MNTQIAQITQSLAANGCAYITPATRSTTSRTGN